MAIRLIIGWFPSRLLKSQGWVFGGVFGGVMHQHSTPPHSQCLKGSRAIWDEWILHITNFFVTIFFAADYCTVDQCLKPGVIAYFRDGTVTGEVPEAKLKALEKSMAKNALTADNYMPGRGFTFFHSIGDEVVPYCNFESVCNTWGVNLIEALSYQSNTTLHVGTGTAFFLWYCGDLVNEIINDEWAPCEKTVGGGLF